MKKQVFCEYSGWENQAQDPSQPGFQCVDSHLHLYDFLHESDGLEPLVKAMDNAGVEKAVLFGMPMVKLWNEYATEKPKPAYMYNDSRFYHYSATDYILLHTLANAPVSIRNRFFPFVCGLNTSDLNAALHLERLLKDFSEDIYGIGEIMSRHDDLTAMTYGEIPRADHPAMLRILDIAAENNLPVLIHHNMAESYLDSPQYLPEMERAICHNPSAKIIWAHVGISRRTELSNLPELTERLLSNYDNLFFDISWFVYDNYIMKDEASLDIWCRIFEKYQEQFLFGTDCVGHWGNYGGLVQKYHPLFTRLPEGISGKIARGNILSLLPVKSVKH